MLHFYRALWLALLTCALSVRASTPPDSLRQALDHLFAPLDKSQVPAPYLVDYGYRFLRPTAYDGTLTDSSRTSPAIFRMAYATVRYARIFGSTTLPTLDALNARVEAAEQATPAADAQPGMLLR